MVFLIHQTCGLAIQQNQLIPMVMVLQIAKMIALTSMATPLGSLQGCLDADGDGRTVEYDVLPSDKTQWNDTDGDGFGDEPTGNLADDCPTTYGIRGRITP